MHCLYKTLSNHQVRKNEKNETKLEIKSQQITFPPSFFSDRLELQEALKILTLDVLTSSVNGFRELPLQRCTQG